MNAAPRIRPSAASWLLGGFSVLCLSAAVVAKEREPVVDDPTSDPQVLNAGRELFARVWAPKDPRSHGGDGLGPVFNAQSCLACHDQGGPGGAGPASRNIEVVTATGGATSYGYSYGFAMDFGSGRFEYRFGTPGTDRNRNGRPLDRNLLGAIHPGFLEARSVVLHRFGTDVQYPAWRDTVAGPHGTVVVQAAERNPTPLFGMGLIDAIPDQAIEDAARRRTSAAGKVRGRVGHQKDGRIGRFGWKAQTATLADFVRAAAANEIGLEVPGQHQAADPRLPGIGASGLDMDESECAALTAYVRSLRASRAKAAEGDGDEAAIKAGASAFKSLGCADCHLPRLGDVEGIYSDLLLHDMGPRLGDSGVYGVLVAGRAPAAAAAAPAGDGGRADENAPAAPQEWRTPPLWGLRDSKPYLHDGRAATIEQAIALHAGQGQASAHRYAQLSSRRKQQLDAFLKSLSVPGVAEDKAGLAKAR